MGAAWMGVDVITGWMVAGAVIPLIGLWSGLCVADVLLQKALRAAVHGEIVHRPPVPLRFERRAARYAPSQRLAALLPAFEPRSSRGYHVTGTSAATFGQLVLVVSFGVLVEEGLSRGVPLLLARLLVVDPLGIVTVGTLLWAFLHGTGRGIALSLTAGWFLAGIWLFGQWELAVGFHLLTNLTGLCWRWYR